MKQPTINPDGVSIKGCDIIYAPKGQAGEYAKLATNPYSNCGHQCLYCYVPAVLKKSREEFDGEAVLRKDYLSKLEKDARKYQAAGIKEQVLLCFTTDPYHPGYTTPTRSTLNILREHGLSFCTLTKGGTRALRDIDLFRSEHDAFAATLTTLDDEVSRLWEPKAALPGDRIEALKAFHQRGIYTWVSLEPVIDTETTLEIIRQTHGFVNLYKVGRLNYHRLTKLTNWQKFAEQVIELLTALGSDYYIKKDLQPLLPSGCKNEIYRPQYRVV